MTCRPGKELVLSKEKADPLPAAVTAKRGPSGIDAAAGVTPVGLRPPFVTPAAAHSHPDCRGILILIVAPHEARSADAKGTEARAKTTETESRAAAERETFVAGSCRVDYTLRCDSVIARNRFDQSLFAWRAFDAMLTTKMAFHSKTDRHGKQSDANSTTYRMLSDHGVSCRVRLVAAKSRAGF